MSPSMRAMFVAAATAGIVLSAESSGAGYYNVTVATQPAAPSPREDTVVTVRGESTDGCTPISAEFEVEAGGIAIRLYRYIGGCPAVLASWEVVTELGRLPAGHYPVRVEVYPYPPEIPFPSQWLASSELEVAERVAAEPFGFAASRMVCRNLTTGQRVAVRTDDAPVNCESYGLVISPGDRVALRLIGEAP